MTLITTLQPLCLYKADTKQSEASEIIFIVHGFSQVLTHRLSRWRHIPTCTDFDYWLQFAKDDHRRNDASAKSVPVNFSLAINKSKGLKRRPNEYWPE